ncbi:MAG: glycosyltransferase [Ginsengibacter sp.]
MVLSVIIVNYNVKYFLEYCLLSVLKAMENIEGEVFVVDNDSTDGSKIFYKEKFPQVNFIWNATNEGFARANNKALKLASGRYLLFLNPDTIVPEDCFKQCISFVQSKGDLVALGIKMIDGSGKFLKESKRAFPSPMTSLYKLSGLTRLFPRSTIFSKYHLGFLDENINHEVDVLAGAFMMIPKKILDTTGAFDESFFMYGEDIDLSYRIQKAGFKNYYFAGSSIVHFKGESTEKGNLNYVRIFYKAMSIFVKKHYGGTKAGVFSALIQAAIFLRAGLAVTARFLKWIGLPVIDAGMILLSFWIVKFFWSSFVKTAVNYSPKLIIIGFSAFTLLFLASSYFAGLYDTAYKQSRLIKSTATAILVLLCVYSLLPESVRFSRGILLFGSVMAFVLMSVVRWLLLRWNIIESRAEEDEINQTVIAGSEEDFNEVNALLQTAGMQERVLGRVEPGDIAGPKTIGSFNNLPSLLHLYPVKEIVFCEGNLSFQKIIGMLPSIPFYLRVKFYTTRAHTLIGSGRRDEAGNYLSKDPAFRLSQPVNLRNKAMADVIIAFLFLITFPVHFILKARPVAFFKNVISVFLLNKTWIGYAGAEKDLPSLKPGILTTTGLPASLNSLPDPSLHDADIFYARSFSTVNDAKIIWLNYKMLS